MTHLYVPQELLNDAFLQHAAQEKLITLETSESEECGHIERHPVCACDSSFQLVVQGKSIIVARDQHVVSAYPCSTRSTCADTSLSTTCVDITCSDDTTCADSDPPPELTTPLVQIPDPPEQIPVFQPPLQIIPKPTTPPVQLFLPDPPPVYIILPDPPPVVETLEPTLMDDSSIDEIMSSVFGDCSQLPPAHTQEPQMLDTVPSLFDESNDLISFLENFETRLAIEQQEAPMDLTMPRMKTKVKKNYWV
ncbi:hypothetical protein TNCV_875191 [Trichonephila clavipes]|nr:hypothetical protein TNCV_875191 [Trichonephila clavipes]